MKKIILIILLLVVFIAAAAIGTSEWYTAQPDFCGSCHIMKKAHKSWAVGFRTLFSSVAIYVNSWPNPLNLALRAWVSPGA